MGCEVMTRNERRRRSTIYDIATAAEASVSTVSLVLNGNWSRYRIKEDTAQRVLTIANQLGYNVNLKARGLRLSKSGLAGMICRTTAIDFLLISPRHSKRERGSWIYVQWLSARNASSISSRRLPRLSSISRSNSCLSWAYRRLANSIAYARRQRCRASTSTFPVPVLLPLYLTIEEGRCNSRNGS